MSACELLPVGSLDTIITPRGASQGFGSWRARLKGVRVLTMEGVGHGGWLQPNEAAADPGLAKRLWELSEKLTGTKPEL